MTIDMFDNHVLPIYRRTELRRKGGRSYNISIYRCATPDEIVWVSGFYYSKPDRYEWYKINKNTRCLDATSWVEKIEDYEEATPKQFWRAVRSVLPLDSSGEAQDYLSASIADDVQERVETVSKSKIDGLP